MRAYVWLLVIHVALSVAGSRRVVPRLDSAGPFEPMIGRSELRRARRYAHWIEVAARHHVMTARCLHRSLVLHRWLRRDGMPSILRIGVRTENGALAAHAWVELGGHVVNDAPAAVASFAPLAIPAMARSEGDRGAAWKSGWE